MQLCLWSQTAFGWRGQRHPAKEGIAETRPVFSQSNLVCATSVQYRLLSGCPAHDIFLPCRACLVMTEYDLASSTLWFPTSNAAAVWSAPFAQLDSIFPFCSLDSDDLEIFRLLSCLDNMDTNSKRQAPLLLPGAQIECANNNDDDNNNNNDDVDVAYRYDTNRDLILRSQLMQSDSDSASMSPNSVSERTLGAINATETSILAHPTPLSNRDDFQGWANLGVSIFQLYAYLIMIMTKLLGFVPKSTYSNLTCDCLL
jgi:hypothetical protein